MSQPTLLFLAGSARKDSLNKKLAKAAFSLAKREGADAIFIDLRDYPMPIYDGDIEAADGLPDNAIELKKLFVESDGFFIASPEYNSSIPPLLKNALDWISRPHAKNEGSLIAYTGKVAALSSASPGALGGLRALVPLRMMLGNIGVTVIPGQLAVSKAHEAFDEKGDFKDEAQVTRLRGLVKEFITMANALKNK